MNRLTALDQARLIFGPRGYAEYRWRGSEGPPLCSVGLLKGEVFEPLVTTDTFEAALAQARPLAQR